MNTKLMAVAVGVREAAALLAVALVPVVANYYSFRIYEPDKNAVLVGLMLLAALAGLVVVGESFRADSSRPSLAALRQPLVLGALLLGLFTCLSAFLAPLAPLSDRIFGASERAIGILNLLACLVLFGTVAATARSAEGRARVVAMLILGTVPASLVAILQGLGVYLVKAGAVENTTRAFGTLANPIFLGAYLMMVLPLTLGRFVASERGGRKVALGLILLAEVAGLLLSASRGPLLGMAAGLAVLLLAWAIVTGRQKLAWGTVGAGALVALMLVLMNLPGGPLTALRQVPVLGRFAQMSDMGSGSQATRMAVWRGMATVVTSDPAVLVLGRGPEAQKYALLNAGQGALGQGAEAERLVDRGHNVLFDQLVTTGLLGSLALWLVLAGWLLTAAQAAGLTPDGARRRLLAICLAVGTLLGALVWVLPGGPPYAGASTLLGLASGLGVYLIVELVRRRGDAGPPESAPNVLALTLLASGAAIVVESAFGIQTVATQAVLWALAGLTLAVSYTVSSLEPAGAAAAPARTTRPEAGTVTLSWSPASGALGLVGGAVASSLAFTYFVRGVPTTLDTVGLVVALTLFTLAAGALVAADAGATAAGFALTALPVWLAYLALQWLTLTFTQDAAMLWPVTLFWYLALGLLAGWWLRPAVAAKTEAVRGVMAGVYVIAAVVVSTAVYLLAIRPVQGAIYFQSAMANFGQVITTPTDEAAAKAAGALFDRAVALDDQNDAYYSLWSEMYTRLATILPNQADSLRAFQTAQGLIGTAEQLDPNMPYHKFNRGHLQLVAIDRLPAEQRPAVAQSAAVPLQQAFDAIKGSDPNLADELALAKLLSGDTKGALALLEFSLKLAPDRPQTLALQGRALAADNQLPEAQAALEAAYAKGLTGPEMLVSLGEVTRQNGDLRKAVQYYRQAVETGQVRDWQIVYNMGLLYKDLGEFAEAAQFLQLASQLAPPEQQATVQEALDSLVSNTANPGGLSLPGNPAPGQPGSPFGVPAPGAP